MLVNVILLYQDARPNDKDYFLHVQVRLLRICVKW